jgi:flagellin
MAGQCPSGKKNMSFRVNTNVTAMGAYRNLRGTTEEVARSITRLSTGLRINTGADDPAGLIATENFKRQISSMDMAMRNNQDAMNFAKSADGALDEVSRLLRDARALAVGNGNSTVDANQRQANQTQLMNILSSIDRIARTTTFGQKKLLDGSSGTYATINNTTNYSRAFVSGTFGNVSMNANGRLDITALTSAERAQIVGTQTFAGTTSTVTAGTFTVNGYQFTVSAGMTVQNVLSMINEASATTGVTADLGTTGAFILTTSQWGSAATVNLTSAAGILLTASGSTSDAGVDAAATVNYVYSEGTATASASASFASGQGLTLRDTSGNAITLTATGNAAGTATNVATVTAGQSQFLIGANGDQSAYLNLTNFSSSALGLGTIDITGADVSSAVAAIDDAIRQVSSSRGNIGSFIRNTIESNVRSLGVSKENLSASLSSIADVDVAEEMTNFTKLQILQQSGLSVLAQANQAPQAVLSLLRN